MLNSFSVPLKKLEWKVIKLTLSSQTAQLIIQLINSQYGTKYSGFLKQAEDLWLVIFMLLIPFRKSIEMILLLYQSAGQDQ